jgi:esterase/lipase superfamily enzyme
MNNILILVTTLGLLTGCATTPHGTISIPPEVRKMSTTDDALFRDLLTKSGGVAHADMVLYPRSQQKTLTRIEVLTPYDNRQTGQERWFIQHEGGKTTAYLVNLIPNGKDSTTFIVHRELTQGAQ